MIVILLQYKRLSRQNDDRDQDYYDRILWRPVTKTPKWTFDAPDALAMIVKRSRREFEKLTWNSRIRLTRSCYLSKRARRAVLDGHLTDATHVFK